MFRYCKIYKQLHTTILNMSLYNFTRKNEFNVDIKMNLEEFFLSSPTPKKNSLLLIYPQCFRWVPFTTFILRFHAVLFQAMRNF